jgi:hypothetical protein
LQPFKGRRLQKSSSILGGILKLACKRFFYHLFPFSFSYL